MAKIDLKFIDYEDNGYIQAMAFDDIPIVSVYGKNFNGEEYIIHLDKSTAIKFAKTLRTEINKIKESDDFNKLSNTF